LTNHLLFLLLTFLHFCLWLRLQHYSRNWGLGQWWRRPICWSTKILWGHVQCPATTQHQTLTAIREYMTNCNVLEDVSSSIRFSPKSI
jgi:hypothetical protein